MKVAFMASDAIALDCIKMLHAGQCPGFELSCVVSNPDKPKGRGKKMSPNDVSAWAIENGVELKGIGLTLTRETYYQPAFLGALDMVCLKQMAQKQTVIVL